MWPIKNSLRIQLIGALKYPYCLEADQKNYAEMYMFVDK